MQETYLIEYNYLLNNNGGFNLYLYTQSTEGRKSPGEIHNRLTRALTNSHTCTFCNQLSHELARTNQQKFKYITLKRCRFL